MTTEADLLAQARILLARGDFAAVDRVLVPIDADSPAYAESLVLSAHAALGLGRPRQAEQMARTALEHQPRVDAALAHGEALMALNDGAGAQRSLDYALTMDPENVDALILLGHTHAMRDDPRRAIHSYQEALRVNEGSEAARFYMADSLVRLGDVVRASTQLHMVLQRAPNYGPAYVLRGDIAAHHGDNRQAAADYCKGIELGVGDATLYERLGMAFHAIEDPAQAVKAFDCAIHLDHGRYASYEAAGMICEQQGWLNRARRYYQPLQEAEGFGLAVRDAMERIAEGIARSGLEGIDPPGAPPEEVDLRGFKPPRTLDKAPAPRPRPGSRVQGAPPPIEDLMAPPRAANMAPLPSDGMATSKTAYVHLAAFRDPGLVLDAPPAAAPDAETTAPPEPADAVVEKLNALQQKLKGWLK